MPRLACYNCGRTIWATAPLAMLFADERRCPRCGANLHDDRRANDRRQFERRQGPANVPAGGKERRQGERRKGQRRRRIPGQ